jgi:predicted enzyme related to lactoylglutathione lyase
MILRLAYSHIYVLDQERAKAFYTEKLGFEVRDDVTLGDFRWLTVAPKTQPDAAIVLMPLKETHLMDADDVRALKKLLEKGVLGGGVLDVDDCQKTYEELKAKGVVFAREPKEMPYGVEALMRDDSNNFFSVTQRRK